jgi:orotidine-5'-phosphate decarboxylase
VLAVTVLTSIDDDELNAVGVPGLVSDEVVVLAKLALSSGCAGVVASAQEASELRRQFGDKFLIVTPGVRPAGSDHGDQARVVTPAQAIEAGASHIVVGRPIVEAANPAQAVKEILAQMSLGTAAISV